MDTPQQPQVGELCTRFLEQYEASPARRAVLRYMVQHICSAFGDRTLDELGPHDVAQWRASLPPATRWQATQALKQIVGWAARWGFVENSAVMSVANPRPWRSEFQPFESWAEITRLSEALPGALGLLPIVGAGCGLRPGELLGLDWSSIDLERRTLLVRASCVDGEVRLHLKTRASRRSVPLRDRLATVLESHRRETGLLFSSRSGGPLDLHNFRNRHWKPALVAAGIESHRIYDLRHTYATWSLRAGVGIFQLARRMGTSVAMIEATYGHFASDADEHERGLLDAWDLQNNHVSSYDNR